MRPRSNRNPKSSLGAWGLSAIAIANLVAPMAIVAPARAAVLHNWAFDPGTRAFTFTLPDGITPDFFLMAEPARIVLEIPDTTLGAVPAAQQYNGAVRSIRLSDVAGGARVVVELAPNTRLDPRHAELTATALGNGQTEWTLQPLLQDVPAAPVAVAPPSPTPAVSAPPQATPPATPAPAPPAPVAAPSAPPAIEEGDESADTTPAVNPAGADEPAAEAVPAIADTGPTTAPTTPEAPETEEPEAAIAAESTEPPVPITVTPSPDSAAAPAAALPDRSALPDVANSATRGAAQSLPTGPDRLAGVSTEADRLAATTNDALSDLPPEQLPLDPFAASQPAVSVPDLADADRTPAPAVTVPPLADVPDAPVAAQNAGTTATPSTGVPPDQVRPPGPRPGAATAVTSAAPPVPPTSPTPAAPAVAPPPVPEAIAANSLEVPTIPLPPEHWRDRQAANSAPSQVRPPLVEATSPPPAVITSPPPTASAPSATTAAPPPFLSSPPPASPASAIGPPPTQVAPPAVPVERATMPPPPPVGRETETLPFGAPLPPTPSSINGEPSPGNGARSVLPPGTRLALQYVGAAPLVLSEQEPVYEVLVVAQDVYDSATGAMLLPSGAQVIGRFEQVDVSSRRFVAQSIVQGRDRLPLGAVSGRLAGSPQPNGVDVALGSGIGAVAMTLLTGFSGIGLLGGAAMGAMGGLAESPALVTIAPGTVIEVQVVADRPPASAPPAVSQRP